MKAKIKARWWKTDLQEKFGEFGSVHNFVQADHQTAPIEIAKTLKSISAVYIFTKFPKLKGRKFWGSGLWSRGTFYGSVGETNEESVKNTLKLSMINTWWGNEINWWNCPGMGIAGW
jgi:REP element-mobilizing transposase RayT